MCLILITPDVARDLAGGYSSKDILEDSLIKTACIPLESRTFANYWGNPGSSFDSRKYSLSRHLEKIAQVEGAENTETPPWLEWTGKEKMDTVPAMQKEKNVFLVTGDAARNKELCLPGGGSATIKIILPKNWDELMAKRGYKPLKEYCLDSELKPDASRRQPRGYSKPGARGDVEYRRINRNFPSPNGYGRQSRLNP